MTGNNDVYGTSKPENITFEIMRVFSPRCFHCTQKPLVKCIQGLYMFCRLYVFWGWFINSFDTAVKNMGLNLVLAQTLHGRVGVVIVGGPFVKIIVTN